MELLSKKEMMKKYQDRMLTVKNGRKKDIYFIDYDARYEITKYLNKDQTNKLIDYMQEVADTSNMLVSYDSITIEINYNKSIVIEYELAIDKIVSNENQKLQYRTLAIKWLRLTTIEREYNWLGYCTDRKVIEICNNEIHINMIHYTIDE